MTALRQYDKIETTGLWREPRIPADARDASPQRREVYVSFGDTSLMIRDKHDAPLAHWSLAAVSRQNPGATPAIFSPVGDDLETLEIEDSTMIDAIERVRANINRRRPHPGRLRWVIFLTLSAAIAAFAVFWLPGALERQTLRAVPFETRRQIGRSILNEIKHLTGRVCSTTGENRALGRLQNRLNQDPRGRIFVLADGIAKSVMLPGRITLLNKTLVEDFEQPGVAAGYMLVEQLRARGHDPLARLLQRAGAIQTFKLLTTGEISRASLSNYAQNILTSDTTLPDTGNLLAAFARAGFASSPMAYAIDVTGETTLPLIEADPFRNQVYKPLLSDSDWIALQGICGG